MIVTGAAAGTIAEQGAGRHMDDLGIAIVASVAIVLNLHLNVPMQRDRIGGIAQTVSHAVQNPIIAGCQGVVNISQITVYGNFMPLAVAALKAGKIIIAAASVNGRQYSFLAQIPSATAAYGC